MYLYLNQNSAQMLYVIRKPPVDEMLKTDMGIYTYDRMADYGSIEVDVPIDVQFWRGKNVKGKK